MSAVHALANLRHIKASHRRRWKRSTGHSFYANNNPYTFVDPDGREAACFSTGVGCGLTPITPEIEAQQLTAMAGLAGAVAMAPAAIYVGTTMAAVAADTAAGSFIGAVTVNGPQIVASTEIVASTAAAVATGGGAPLPTVRVGAPKPAVKFATPTNAPQAAPASMPTGHSVRVMPATQQYPNGYWVQTNQHGQPVNPSTGKPPGNVTRPDARAQTHVPLPPLDDKRTK